MEKDIHGYVARRIQEIKQDLEDSKRYLQEDELELEKAEERIYKEVNDYENGLREKCKYTEEQIRESVINMLDALEDRLDDARDEITTVRNHIFALEYDLVIYENFGR